MNAISCISKKTDPQLLGFIILPKSITWTRLFLISPQCWTFETSIQFPEPSFGMIKNRWWQSRRESDTTFHCPPVSSRIPGHTTLPEKGLHRVSEPSYPRTIPRHVQRFRMWSEMSRTHERELVLETGLCLNKMCRTLPSSGWLMPLTYCTMLRLCDVNPCTWHIMVRPPRPNSNEHVG